MGSSRTPPPRLSWPGPSSARRRAPFETTERLRLAMYQRIQDVYNHPDMDPNRFQRIAKALADPRRFEIFEVMAASADELACGRIVERFPVTQATVSHHLKELTDEIGRASCRERV